MWAGAGKRGGWRRCLGLLFRTARVGQVRNRLVGYVFFGLFRQMGLLLQMPRLGKAFTSTFTFFGYKLRIRLYLLIYYMNRIHECTVKCIQMEHI